MWGWVEDGWGLLILEIYFPHITFVIACEKYEKKILQKVSNTKVEYYILERIK